MEPYLPVNQLIQSKRMWGELRGGLKGITQHSPRNSRICHSRFKFIKTLKSYKINITSIFQTIGPTVGRDGGAGGQSSHCRHRSIRVIYEDTGCLRAFDAVYAGVHDVASAAVICGRPGYAATAAAVAHSTRFRAADATHSVLYPVKTIGAVGWSHICQLIVWFNQNVCGVNRARG